MPSCSANSPSTARCASALGGAAAEAGLLSHSASFLSYHRSRPEHPPNPFMHPPTSLPGRPSQHSTETIMRRAAWPVISRGRPTWRETLWTPEGLLPEPLLDRSELHASDTRIIATRARRYRARDAAGTDRADTRPVGESGGGEAQRLARTAGRSTRHTESRQPDQSGGTDHARGCRLRRGLLGARQTTGLSG